MTTSTGYGYPDWDRVTSALSAALYDDAPDLGPGENFFGPWAVGPWPTVTVFYEQQNTPLVAFSLTVQFYDDETEDNLLGQFTWYSDNGEPIYDAVAALGPWVRILTNNLDMTHSDQCAIRIGAVSAPVSDARLGPTKQLLFEYDETVDPSSATDIPFAFVTTGPASFQVYTPAALWDCELVAKFHGSFIFEIARFNNTAASPFQPVTLYLPPYPIYCVFNNGDLSSQSFNASVMIP